MLLCFFGNAILGISAVVIFYYPVSFKYKQMVDKSVKKKPVVRNDREAARKILQKIFQSEVKGVIPLPFRERHVCFPLLRIGA